MEIPFTLMIQRGKFIFRFAILKWFHSGPTVIAVISTLLHFRFTKRNACKMASNELQPCSVPTQCECISTGLNFLRKRSISTEALKFFSYVRGKSSTKERYISTEPRRLILRKSYISTEESRDCFHRTALFIRNDLRFTRNVDKTLRKDV